MANRVSQAPVEVVVSPTDANSVVSQVPVEVIVAPTDAKAIASQAPVEVVVSPTDANAIVSHTPVEVVIANNIYLTPAKAHLALTFHRATLEIQQIVLALRPPPARLKLTFHVSDLSLDVRISQAVIEGVTEMQPGIRLTSEVAEVAVFPTDENVRLTSLTAEVVISGYQAPQKIITESVRQFGVGGNTKAGIASGNTRAGLAVGAPRDKSPKKGQATNQ